MAATLMEIKSRMLLPKGEHAVDPNAEDDDVDPRWELVYQLLQYKKFKEAAESLGELARARQDLMDRHVSSRRRTWQAARSSPSTGSSSGTLFNLVLRRLAEKLVVGEIHDEVITVADQMEWLLGRMRTEPTFVFSQPLHGPRLPPPAGGDLPRRARADAPAQAAPAAGRGLCRHRLRGRRGKPA